MKTIHKEWFWSQRSAQEAGSRLQTRHGFSFTVKHKMRADGRHDWLLSVFES